MGDLVEDGQRLLVARGGFHGLGNVRYKSSPFTGLYRVVRGGGWSGTQRGVRVASATGSGLDTRGAFLGFRIAMDAPPVEEEQ